MAEQQYFIGNSSFNNLAKIVEQYRPHSVMLVRGKTSYTLSGAAKMMEPIFQKNAIQIVEFMEFSVNPKIEEVEKGIEILQHQHVDMILTIGGGSALDVAKAIRFFYTFEQDENTSAYKQIREPIPLVALPTTAGTGSEATHFAVLYKNGHKQSIAHSAILPDVAIVDPIFTLNASPYLTACTGFDALAQAIEAYWNINATVESDGYAEKAIRALREYLPALISDGQNMLLREKIATASFFAGKAINITKTTAPHAFSYPFTTHYGYPHGHAVAMTFPFFMQFNYAETQAQLLQPLLLDVHLHKMRQIYAWLGIKTKDDATETMKKFINRLGLSLELPTSFNAKLITANVNVGRLGNNPRVMSDLDIISVVDSMQIYN
ncbi:alcohol dehydrogenase [Bacteroidia bacterium]|nr:alcohol dehydrogenase [Bacteroidia bacterium]